MASHLTYADSAHFWIWPSQLAEQNSKMCRICIRGHSQTTLTRFVFFWPPTPLRLHFLWYKSLHKVDFFWPPTPPPLVNVVCERPPSQMWRHKKQSLYRVWLKERNCTWIFLSSFYEILKNVVYIQMRLHIFFNPIKSTTARNAER